MEHPLETTLKGLLKRKFTVRAYYFHEFDWNLVNGISNDERNLNERRVSSKLILYLVNSNPPMNAPLSVTHFLISKPPGWRDF